ncbi:hypothetical protein EA58_11895 [Photobacterium galatheae]|uniref:Uncharacterized protein n=2 Tax=Photobacterium galatheae TaxID=1654360 RepID=A0A066RLF2_9GAMM|nr:hypothetical protein EA58_11895 [Photobacterium galatheae]
MNAAFHAVRDIFPKISDFLSIHYPRYSQEDCLQTDLRTSLKYSIEKFLSSKDDWHLLLDEIFDGISAVTLLDYSAESVILSHDGYFIPRFESQLMARLKHSFNRTDHLPASIGKDLAKYCPDIACRVLPLVFDYEWGIGTRMTFSDALYSIGYRSTSVLRYYALYHQNFHDDFYSSPECFPLLIENLDYLIHQKKCHLTNETLTTLENWMAQFIDDYPASELTYRLMNKWQGASWSQREIKLCNGWEFRLSRSHYAEECWLTIGGGERGRDRIFPDYPEQLEWVHACLKRGDLGSYTDSWEIHFSIYGEALLQHLLKEIETFKLDSCMDEKPQEAWLQ